MLRRGTEYVLRNLKQTTVMCLGDGVGEQSLKTSSFLTTTVNDFITKETD